MVTATPEFFQGKKKSEIRAYFQEALTFIQQNQAPKTIISAVVHMDEKTPHMHLSFVPLTPDGRLSAKEIVGNKKKLTQWQDKFWEHMVRKYPDLERGESASQTGRDHIPPRVFKEMTRLTKQKAKLEELLAGIGAFNAKSRAAEIAALLDLNDHGYKKKIRQNGTIPGFSSAFVKDILDNPVYMGKIAYGRRRTEKKLGTRNEMHVVEQDEFPIYDGQHEAIISEEDWNLAQDKRKANAFRREKVIDPEHAHILSGILKCPCCGKSLYGNIAKAHSKDKKTRYYYYCKNTLGATGHKCTFRVNIEQTEMNRMVAAIISAMVNDPQFSKAIKAKIGTSVDTEDLEKQLVALQAQLRQTLGIKARLERQMDTLDINDPYFDRKILDLQRRYDEQYGRIEEIETQIDEVKSQIQSIRQEKISGENIYQLLLAFDEVYGAATEIEQKEFMRAFIERIDLYPEKQKDGNWIRNMVFNFPVPVNGQEVKELPLESGTTLETVVLLRKAAP